MKIIGLLIGLVLLMVMAYFWYSTSILNPNRQVNYDSVNTQVDDMQQKVERYDKTLERYQDQIDKGLGN